MRRLRRGEKGYGFGRPRAASEGDAFHDQIARSAAEFAGPFAIAIARGIDRLDVSGIRLNILVPVRGTPASRQGAELAIALAQASHGSLTAIHIASGQARAPRSWRREFGAALAPMTSADAIIREIVRLGDPYGVEVRGAVSGYGAAPEAILRQIENGRHNLVVMGGTPTGRPAVLWSGRRGGARTSKMFGALRIERAVCFGGSPRA